jgi:hypothetical protein
MGIYREYNPLMEGSWHTFTMAVIQADYGNGHTSYKVADWSAMGRRAKEACEWAKGPLIHGRFSYHYKYGGYTFYFKNSKDILPFKLAWGGE